MEPQNNSTTIRKKLNDPYWDTHFVTRDAFINIPLSFKLSGTESAVSKFNEDFNKYFNEDCIKIVSITEIKNKITKLKKQHKKKKHKKRLY